MTSLRDFMKRGCAAFWGAKHSWPWFEPPRGMKMMRRSPDERLRTAAETRRLPYFRTKNIGGL